AGDNTIAVLAWHFGKDGYAHRNRGTDAGGLLFESRLDSAGVIASDASWKTRVHAGFESSGAGTQPNVRLAESNIYYDARAGAPLEGWTARGFDDASWPAATDRGSAGVPPWNALVPRPVPLFRFTDIQSY